MAASRGPFTDSRMCQPRLARKVSTATARLGVSVLPWSLTTITPRSPRERCGFRRAATARLPTESPSRYRCADARETSQERNRHNGSILWSDWKSRKARQQLDRGLSLPRTWSGELAEEEDNNLLDLRTGSLWPA